MKRCTYISYSYLDNTIMLLLDTNRYEYFLHSSSDVANAVRLLERWPGKGLNWLKKHAKEVRKII